MLTVSVIQDDIPYPGLGQCQLPHRPFLCWWKPISINRVWIFYSEAGGDELPVESPKHRRISKKVVRVLKSIGFSENEIHVSHRPKARPPDESAMVQLHRLGDHYERRTNGNRVKIPDIAAQKQGITLFVEVETSSTPSVIVGDLHCIDLADTVYFRRGDRRERLPNCIAVVVIDKLETESKRRQIRLLRHTLGFRGAVRDFEICTKSNAAASIEDLLRRNNVINDAGDWVDEGYDESTRKRLNEVEDIIGIQFHDRALLLRALTRREYLEKHKKPYEEHEHQEALATLGDAILRAVLTEHHFETGPQVKGSITIKRVETEKNKYLADCRIARKVSHYVRTSEDEERRDVPKKEIPKATTLEAIIGALFLERGYNRSRKDIERLVEIGQ